MTAHALQDPSLLDGFDWDDKDFFTQCTYNELKKEQARFSLAVITTHDAQGNKVKHFCSAQELARYLLLAKQRLDPVNQQPIVSLDLLFIQTIIILFSNEAIMEFQISLLLFMKHLRSKI